MSAKVCNFLGYKYSWYFRKRSAPSEMLVHIVCQVHVYFHVQITLHHLDSFYHMEMVKNYYHNSAY